MGRRSVYCSKTKAGRGKCRGALLVSVVLLLGPRAFAGEGDGGKLSCEYLAWTAYRFSKTTQDDKRDARWFADLGFTQSYIGQGSLRKEDAERHKKRLAIFAKYGMTTGLRFHWPSRSKKLAKEMGIPYEKAVGEGMVLLKKPPPGMGTDVNFYHPAVIRFVAEEFAGRVKSYRLGEHAEIFKVFLLGTEMGIPTAPPAGKAHPQALAYVVQAARTDGLLAADEAYDAKKLKVWGQTFEKGGSHRVRKATEEAILKIVPDAEFTTDPIWAVQIVHGHGQDWSYIGNDPKHIANASVRLLAQSRPAPASQLVQLIRTTYKGAFIPSVVLREANLLTFCMGARRTGHWGIQAFEPGRQSHYYYGSKDRPSPPGFPLLADDPKHIEKWDAIIAALAGRTKDKHAKAAGFLAKRLGKRIHDEIEAASITEGDEGLDLGGGGLLTPELKKAVLAKLNELIRGEEILYAANAFKGLKLNRRVRKQLGRLQQGPLDAEERAELNRLLVEAALRFGLVQSDTPTIVQRKRDYRRTRSVQEPVLRTTGRFIEQYGELIEAWTPLEARLALLGGIYGHAELNLALIVGHIPFDILRNQKDRRAHLAKYRYVAVKKGVGPQDYADLVKVDRAGGTVFLPEGFTAPGGAPALKNAKTWQPFGPPPNAKDGKKRRKKSFLPSEPEALNEALVAGARSMRGQLHAAGFLPYFDTDNPEVVMQGFAYKGIPVVMIVNDKREFDGASYRKVEDKALPNQVDLLIRDKAADLTVRNIETGETLDAVRKADGWHVADTIEPAWYRLYAVLKNGQTWPGPARAPAAPAIQDLKAAPAEDKGVQLTWRVDVEDWVGCDLQWVRIYRGEEGAAPVLLAEIYGRPVSGPGGLVTAYTDRTSETGKRYTYRVQGVSPLLRPGAMSEAAGATAK